MLLVVTTLTFSIAAIGWAAGAVPVVPAGAQRIPTPRVDGAAAAVSQRFAGAAANQVVEIIRGEGQPK